MCDVQKELSNGLDSVSNALGTDGSKNGLLNDPVSMAALAVGTGIYFAPELGITGAATAGTGAAATEAALIPLEVMAPLGNSAVASVTAGSAAAAGSWVPSWMSLENVAGVAGGVAKTVLPAILQNSRNAQQFSQQKELLTLQNQRGQYGYAPATTVQPGGVSVKGLGSFLPMLIIGGAAYAAYKLTR